jgi:hypothetical protein
MLLSVKPSVNSSQAKWTDKLAKWVYRLLIGRFRHVIAKNENYRLGFADISQTFRPSAMNIGQFSLIYRTVGEKLFSAIFEINYEFFIICFETSFHRYFFIFFTFFSKGESASSCSTGFKHQVISANSFMA